MSCEGKGLGCVRGNVESGWPIMIPFNHYFSGVYWGFGTINRMTGERTAVGDFCYLVMSEESGEIERWEGSYFEDENLRNFDERVRMVQL